MNERGRLSVTFCTSLCAIAIAVAACVGGATAPGSAESTAFAGTPTASTDAFPSADASASVSPSSDVPTPTPASSGSPGEADPTMSPPPTLDARPGAVCSGSAENIPFWTQAAAWLTFDVYCAVLPKGWYLSAARYDSHNVGWVTAAYAGPGGATIQIKQGKFCTESADACSPHDAVLGPAFFGDKAATLYSLAGGGFAIYVNPGAVPAWQITGAKISHDTFLALAAALRKVAKR